MCENNKIWKQIIHTLPFNSVIFDRFSNDQRLQHATINKSIRTHERKNLIIQGRSAKSFWNPNNCKILIGSEWNFKSALYYTERAPYVPSFRKNLLNTNHICLCVCVWNIPSSGDYHFPHSFLVIPCLIFEKWQLQKAS